MTFFNRGVRQKVAIASADVRFEVLEFDASISETHTGAAEATSHPVEDGSEMSDHVRRMPEELQINGVVTDHPIVYLRSTEGRPAVQGGDPRNRAKDVYFLLRRWKNDGQRLGVSTTLRAYQNMVIISFSVARDKDSGNMLNANLTLREIVTAKTEIVPAKEPTPEKAGRRQAANQGTKTKTENSPGSPVEDRSLAIRIID